MEFELTEGQKAAMAMIEGLMKDKSFCQVGVLTGFAGTGKTTMIKTLVSQFGMATILCPTGKAAIRVREATGYPAGTIHRWLYRPAENQKTGEVEFAKKDVASLEVTSNNLIIVDEASMVGRDIWEDLWNVCQLRGMKILLVGDPFQLPPIETGPKDEDQFVPLIKIDTKYRAHLSEVTRQAMDSPILRASMLLRESNVIGPALQLLNRVYMKNFQEKCFELQSIGGAIIVHRNLTRHALNRMVRDRLKYDEEIRPGEPLLVIRNNYPLERFNGEIVLFDHWTPNNDKSPTAVVDRWKNVSKQLTFGVGVADTNKNVLLCPEQVAGNTQDIGDNTIERAGKAYYENNYAPSWFEPYLDDVWQGPAFLHCNFGYTLTAHKSQGSEWGQGIFLIEKSVRASSLEGRRWIYTAATRFREKCYFANET